MQALLNSINRHADVDSYVWLLGELQNLNVSQNQEYQRVYRRYWQINPTRLSKEYLAAYFGHFEQLKAKPQKAMVEAVIRHLLPIPTHGNVSPVTTVFVRK